jgi:ADP-L-glycero-D-manno-heptose 6-epimerase
MKILITGYKGFIGKNLVEYLKDHTLSFYEPSDTLPSVDGLDWVIHLGALTSTTETNVELVLENNYDFSRWLVNECLKHNVNFQYSSSASVYGQNKDFNENSPVNPQSPYAWSKYLFDRYITHTAGSWPIKVQGFRYFNVYGPHEDHKGNQASPYHKFEKQAKDTGVIKLFEGSDKFFRDFVPVETVCKIHKHFLGVSETGIWNIGTGQATSFENVARMIADKHDAHIEYIPMPENLKHQYQEFTCADIGLLRKHYKTMRVD